MSKPKYYALLLSLLLATIGRVNAQSFNQENLLKIAKEQSVLAKERADRVSNYLVLHPNTSKVFYTDEEEVVVLYDIVNGLPQYKTTYNEQARLTTGVEFVQSATGLNLPLFGQGITIGVWDGGLVLNSHAEFGGRVTNKMGTEYSNHATHVTGTIAASGVDPKAKGMMPEANIHAYYAFDDDLGPMALEASEGLILSNHSYGLVLGWRFNPGSNGWNWLGGADDKDETFGAYTANSRAIDDITFNAPYYTIVWSAGNDRSDVGDGTRPPDGPFDIIGPAAGSKNIITVGAITGFEEYLGPESAVMSTFSSWGPTNDGRIKPDVVADGVGVYSAGSAGDNSYATLQGTSMSAPNTTGTLGVIQQYYRSKQDTFMTAAQLKSLVIHTAREAGQNPGPDYKYGWGVVNAIDAVKMITGAASADTLLLSETLVNNEVHEYEVYSDGQTPITATIVWTDVPGTVREEISILPNLVNDLDIKLVDDLGNEVLPWKLDPANVGKAAIKAVNNVDNVEKIEFPNPKARRYRLVVSHKNSLVNNEQTYALSLSYRKADVSNNISYWINGSGTYSSDSHYSLASGGASTSIDPATVETMVIDENSFDGPGAITLDGDVSLKNLIFTSDDLVTMDLAGNTMEISSPLYIANEKLKIMNGTLKISSAKSQPIALNFDGSEGLTVQILQEAGTASLSTSINLAELELLVGNVEVNEKDINLNSLSIAAGVELAIEKSAITINDRLEVNGSLIAKDNTWSIVNGSVGGGEAILLLDNVTASGNTVFMSKVEVMELNNLGMLRVEKGVIADSLKLSVGSEIILIGSDSLVINKSLDLDQESEGIVTITGDVTENSKFLYNSRNKFCVDNLNISNIDFTSKSVFNVGDNSTLTNTNNILQLACGVLLFPDFEVRGTCNNSLIELTDISDGSIATYSWKVLGQVHFVEGLSSPNPVIWFEEAGEYQVELTIANDLLTESYTKTIVVTDNTLAQTQIVKNDQGLVATANAATYQWFYNGEMIEGGNQRILSNPLAIGAYHVAYYKESNCGNSVSPEFFLNTITALDKTFDINPVVYPNPFKNNLIVDKLKIGDKLIIIDMRGKIIYQQQATASMATINLENNQNQLLILKIQRGDKIFNQKLIQTR